MVLANYFPWYDPGTWSNGCTSDSDQPRDGVYHSDDPGVIARHIGQARAAGIDGFAVHWFAPGNRTDANFEKVLNLSPEGFQSTITFLYHILPGANQQLSFGIAVRTPPLLGPVTARLSRLPIVTSGRSRGFNSGLT
jgi:hypothetical protein